MSKEKKGDVLNQLAIISDLIEKVAIDSNASTVFYELDEDQYEEVYEYIKEKFKGEDVEENDSGTFSILIGEVSFMFSKNSV
jgi:hypothetical protein